MTDAGSLAGALLLGLMGSTHCIGMCGGISAALGMAGGKNAFWFGVCYNLGRIACYAALGALAGGAVSLLSAGLSALLPSLGLWLRTIAGLLVIAMGLYIGGWWLGLTRLEALGSRVWRRVQPLTKTLFPPRNMPAALLLGAAWGLLPCGLIYSSLTWAAAAADPFRGATLMAAFGAGTLPAMLLTTFGGQTLQRRLQQRWVRRGAGALLIAFGIASIAVPWWHALNSSAHLCH
jgi:sulfite exporter TauE/SafE